VHKTTLDEIPYAMCAFQGRVLVGVGKLLRLYDLGKKKLLRKCENKVRFGAVVLFLFIYIFC
jgi:splicing factor 3B subunit 3